MYKYTKEELVYIWIDSFLGLEYKHKIKLVNYVDLDKPSFNLPFNREQFLSVIDQKTYSTLLTSANTVYLDYVLQALDKRGITAIALCSNNYPQSLIEVPFAPFVLYAIGDVSLLSNKYVFGIVGSRRSLPLSIKLAENYAKELSNADFTLVTGTADGIDKAVLQTALSNGGKIISVVAGGFDHVYPATNRELIEKVAKRGLIISEYPPETLVKPYHFPVRNRIISALSLGVLIVSAGLKSGTMYTAEYAVEYGKDLFAIPYNVGVQSGTGCNELIKKGALLTDSPKDVLDFYGVQSAKTKVEIAEQERLVLNALSNGEQHVERLAELLCKRAYEIMPTLSILEIKGLVTKSGNIYGLTGNYLED